MYHWIRTHLIPDETTPWWLIALVTGATIAMFFGSIALTAWALVRLPADYFRGDKPHNLWAEHHPALRWVLRVGKNLLGVVLIIAGLIMSIPGVPGQGILTTLLGVMLVDFPGKRQCEQWIVKKRRVRASIDRVRAKFGKAPLILDE
jgi:hypothetical protein